jgi:hypothetical protein
LSALSHAPRQKSISRALRNRLIASGGTYYSFMAVKQLPAHLPEQFICRLLQRFPFLSVSLSTFPLSKRSSVERIDRALTRCGSEIIHRTESGKQFSHLAELNIELEELKQAIISDRTLLIEATIVFCVSSTSAEAIAPMLNELTAELDSAGISIFEGRFEQEKLYGQFSHLMPPSFDISVTVTEQTLPSLVPFSQTPLIHREGVLVGLDAADRSPVIFDRFAGSNFNSVIVGKSGSGKSYFAKLMLIRENPAHTGSHNFILDPLGEFEHVTIFLGGRYINVKRDGIGIGSVIPALNTDLIPGIEDLFCRILGQDVTASAFRESFRRHLKNDSTRQISAILGAVAAEMAGEGRTDAAATVESALAGELRFLTEGRWILGDVWHVNTIDYSDLGPAVKDALSVFLLDCIFARCMELQGRKSIFIDEAWKFTENRQLLSALSKAMRHSRHYNLSIVLITQNLKDIASDSNGGMMNNSASIFLFRHEKTEEAMAAGLELEEEDYAFINTVVPRELKRSRSILFTGERKILLEHESSDIEFMLCSTDNAAAVRFHSFIPEMAGWTLKEIERMAGGQRQ